MMPGQNPRRMTARDHTAEAADLLLKAEQCEFGSPQLIGFAQLANAHATLAVALNTVPPEDTNVRPSDL